MAVEERKPGETIEELNKRLGFMPGEIAIPGRMPYENYVPQQTFALPPPPTGYPSTWTGMGWQQTGPSIWENMLNMQAMQNQQMRQIRGWGQAPPVSQRQPQRAVRSRGSALDFRFQPMGGPEVQQFTNPWNPNFWKGGINAPPRTTGSTALPGATAYNQPIGPQLPPTGTPPYSYQSMMQPYNQMQQSYMPWQYQLPPITQSFQSPQTQVPQMQLPEYTPFTFRGIQFE